ncbi:hypothetical protein [Cysteiniphilum sp. QT6929]|uniref:hypothetical protein n=1 Tax=Cysteiniphilum sp. QT6929 TaxID=2975055 RepID=UPI0024B334EE|nr:hypothetical protein [Cysteiniphilum sp. QT6929]WHN66210.1 hypothetical protein NYP54_02990 [Cysteiniphilum sp. QT6929]
MKLMDYKRIDSFKKLKIYRILLPFRFNSKLLKAIFALWMLGILGLILSIFINNVWMKVILLMGFMALTVIYILYLDRAIIRYYNLNGAMLLLYKREKLYWRSTKYFMFYEKCPDLLDNPEYLVELANRITKEAEYKRLQILQHPVLSVVAAIFFVALGAFFDKLPRNMMLQALIVLTIFLYFLWLWVGSFRTEEAKLNDFKLILLWGEQNAEELKELFGKMEKINKKSKKN